MPSKLINIGEDFTDEGLARLQVRQLLRFKDGDKVREFRVVTLNKKQKVVMVREVKTYTDKELDEMYPEA